MLYWSLNLREKWRLPSFFFLLFLLSSLPHRRSLQSGVKSSWRPSVLRLHKRILHRCKFVPQIFLVVVVSSKKKPLMLKFCFPSQGFKEKNKFIAAQGKFMNYSSTKGPFTLSKYWFFIFYFFFASQARSLRQWRTSGGWFGSRKQPPSWCWPIWKRGKRCSPSCSL